MEVVAKVLRGCSGGCAEGAWKLYRRCLVVVLKMVEVVVEVVPNVVEVVPNVVEVVPNVVEVVPNVVQVVLYMLEVVNGVRCVLWVLGVYALYAVPYAAL